MPNRSVTKRTMNLTSSSMPTIQQRIKISSRGRKQKVLKKNSDGNNDKNQIKDNQERRRSMRVRKKSQRTNGGIWI